VALIGKTRLERDVADGHLRAHKQLNRAFDSLSHDESMNRDTHRLSEEQVEV
jgi:hypothetical protein